MKTTLKKSVSRNLTPTVANKKEFCNKLDPLSGPFSGQNSPTFGACRIISFHRIQKLWNHTVVILDACSMCEPFGIIKL